MAGVVLRCCVDTKTGQAEDPVDRIWICIHNYVLLPVVGKHGAFAGFVPVR